MMYLMPLSRKYVTHKYNISKGLLFLASFDFRKQLPQLYFDSAQLLLLHN